MPRTIVLEHDKTGDATITAINLSGSLKGELWLTLQWAPSGECSVETFDGDPDNGGTITGGAPQLNVVLAGLYPMVTGPVESVYIQTGTTQTNRIYSYN